MRQQIINLATFRGFIFDLDGVIYKDDQLIEGAIETLIFLEKRDKKVIFVTNHTKYLKHELVQKLQRLGIQLTNDQVLTSIDATINYIKQQETLPRIVRINLVGYGGIIEEFVSEGFKLTYKKPDYVVVAWDPQINYKKLYLAVKNVREGAHFIVTSPDRYIPSQRGFELGFGTLGASIAYATGKMPVYIGKPYPPMIKAAIALMNTSLEETVIIGDTPETDIKSQYLAGLGGSVLVLTGNTTQEEVTTLPRDQKPSIVLKSIKDIQNYLE